MHCVCSSYFSGNSKFILRHQQKLNRFYIFYLHITNTIQLLLNYYFIRYYAEQQITFPDVKPDNALAKINFTGRIHSVSLNETRLSFEFPEEWGNEVVSILDALAQN